MESLTDIRIGTCRACGEIKQYAPRRKICIECRKVYNKQKLKKWHENNPGRAKQYVQKRREKDPEFHADQQRKHRYGITRDEYLALLVACRNKCAICKTDLDKPNIDHDHATGKIRGILCVRCNQGLGHFQDNQTLLIEAVSYLRGASSQA